jgi:pimeloyl-ACP methyl ester carboxylesterase
MENKIKWVQAVAFLCIFLQTVSGQMPVAKNGRLLTIGKTKIYYEESGTGTPLLLLHGFGRTADDWKPFVNSFAGSHRVIALDLPGHGRSSLMDSSKDYLHKKAATLILSFLDSLKLKEVNVVGFSGGAFITLYLSTLRPGLTKKIVVAAGQLNYSDSTRKFISRLGGPQNFITNEEELTPLHGRYKGQLIAEQFWNFRKLYGDPSFTIDVLKTIKAKTLIIHGDNDPIAPVENAFTMYKHIPHAHLWIIPYAEHIGIFAPDNNDEFIKRVSDFLAR